MLLISVAVFGTVGALVRRISLSSGEIALWRAVIALCFLGSVLLLRRQRLSLRAIGASFWLLLLSGAALGINWILLFEAYRFTTVSLATISYYFAPTLVTLLCPILFRERMRGAQWLCFAMATVGLLLIVGTGGAGGGAQPLRGILLGLGAAVFYATVILCNKALRDIESVEKSFFQFCAAILVLLPYVLLQGGIHVHTLAWGGWLCLLTVGFLHTGVAYLLYFAAIGRLSGQKSAILSYLDPLVAVLVSVLFLEEPMTVWQVLGGGMLLGFAMLNEWLGRRGGKTKIPTNPSKRYK